MEKEIIQPEETNPSEGELAPEGSPPEDNLPPAGQPQPTAEALTKVKIEETLGRKFDTLEDALKTIKNVYAENSRLTQRVTQVSQPQPTSPKNEPAYATKDELWELRFITAYPDAREYLDKVKKISRATGEDYFMAFESSGLKEVYEAKRASNTQREKELKNIPPGSNRIPSTKPEELKEAEAGFLKGDQRKSLEFIKLRMPHLFEGME